MAQVNWLEWIVLRCEPKTDTDGNMVEVVVEEEVGVGEVGGTVDWRGGKFPRESHKTD